MTQLKPRESSARQAKGSDKMTKVKLPQDVYEELEEAYEHCFSNSAIFAEVQNGVYQDVYAHFEFDMDALMSALVNGYEVERTPEEKVRAYYDDAVRHSEIAEPNSMGKALYNGRMCAIKETLHLLGIKLEGVNAND